MLLLMSSTVECVLYHFSFLNQSSERSVYDIVVLSLVLNFAGDGSSRGQMLRVAHRLCKRDGHVVVSIITLAF